MATGFKRQSESSPEACAVELPSKHQTGQSARSPVKSWTIFVLLRRPCTGALPSSQRYSSFVAVIGMILFFGWRRWRRGRRSSRSRPGRRRAAAVRRRAVDRDRRRRAIGGRCGRSLAPSCPQSMLGSMRGVKRFLQIVQKSRGSSLIFCDFAGLCCCSSGITRKISSPVHGTPRHSLAARSPGLRARSRS